MDVRCRHGEASPPFRAGMHPRFRRETHCHVPNDDTVNHEERTLNAQFRYFFLPLTLLLFLVAGCGIMQEETSTSEKTPAGAGTKITGAELIDLLSDNTISIHEYGETAIIAMYASGKMYAEKDRKSVV